jgi:hypothetical protein
MLYTRIFSRSNDWGYFPKGFHHLHPLETLRIVEKSTSTQATNKNKMEFQAQKTKYEKGLECQPQNTRDMDCNTGKNRTYPEKMTEFLHVSTTKTAPTPQPPLPRRHGSHGSGDSRNLCGTWASEARPSSERQWYVTRWTDSTWKPPGDGIWMGV